ncbi:hypothetical protein Cgig2_016774 [Carnegiea gigantea]|uniref:Uncharacterized protein n=1 Tax=Carnegiea gigantea TaxID=171969 RepID=A0A9Q1JUM0_9CARY|nr:hypothetical protein Cgig2_016774 [Carnegiea gigantea]
MRKGWLAWKHLKTTETGLGVSSFVEEKWEQIYRGTYATRKNVYAPTMEPLIINIEEQENEHEIESHMQERLVSQGGPSRMNKQQSCMPTIAMAMQLVNRMVENQILEKGRDFWCYATHVLEDAAKREIFLNIDDDDDSRLKWLECLHWMKDK